MAEQLVALGIFVVIFAVSAVRNVNIGLVMFPAAVAVGLWLAGDTVEDVVAGFPLSILVLLVGITYFFGVAHSNGTISWLIEATLARVGDRDALLPTTLAGLTALISAMGAPLGGLVVAPIGMSIAARRRIDPVLMAIAMGCGLSAGAFAPTSLFGIITWGTADSAGITFSPWLLFAVAIAANLVLLIAAHLLFGRSRRADSPAQTTLEHARGSAATLTEYGGTTLDLDSSVQTSTAPGRLTSQQILTMAAMVGLVGAVATISIVGREPDIGVLGFALGAALALVDPPSGKNAMTHIDWGSVLLVGGIITYVGVLTTLGVVDMLGERAAMIGVPLVAAILLCGAAGLISAFASTTGMLAAIVPLALPLIADGGIPGWAMICAIGVCASIVDVSPFSTVGATYVATTVDPDDRPRMTKMLTRWGLSMVVVGPLGMAVTIIIPGMVLA